MREYSYRHLRRGTSIGITEGAVTIGAGRYRHFSRHFSHCARPAGTDILVIVRPADTDIFTRHFSHYARPKAITIGPIIIGALIVSAIISLGLGRSSATSVSVAATLPRSRSPQRASVSVAAARLGLGRSSAGTDILVIMCGRLIPKDIIMCYTCRGCWIVLCLQNGNITQYLRDHGGALPWPTLKKFCLNICSGMRVCPLHTCRP